MFQGDFIMSEINLSLRSMTDKGSVSGDRNHYDFYGISVQQPVSRNAEGGGTTGNGSVSISKRGHRITPYVLAKVEKGLFTTSARTSLDPIMTLVKQAAADTHPDKLDAIVGTYMNDSDELIVPKATIEAASRIHGQGLNMRYAPSAGIKGLATLMTNELLGEQNLENLKAQGIHHSEVVTSGGTGAISTALQACTNPCDPILLPIPGWPGYRSVASAIGHDNLINYKTLDENNNFNINSLKESLDSAVASAPEGSKITLILNTPYNNPSGKEISHNDLMKIARLLKSYGEQKFLVILDTAYIDFGPNGHNDTRLSFISDFLKEAGPNVDAIVASTSSKGRGMYGARVGAATLLTRNQEDANNWPDVAGGVMRGTVSNLSRHGQQMALEILSDPGLMESIHDYQEHTVNIINNRRGHFIETISPILPKELGIIKPDGGFFLSLKVQDEVLEKWPSFAEKLSESLVSDHVYIPIIDQQFIRVPVCGLSEDQLSLLADKIVEHTKTVREALESPRK